MSRESIIYTRIALVAIAVAVVSGAILVSSFLGVETTITRTSTFTTTTAVTDTSTLTSTLTQAVTTTVTTADASCEALGVYAPVQITAANSTGGNSTLNWSLSSERYYASPLAIFINGSLALSSFTAVEAYPGIGVAGYSPIPNGITIVKGDTYDITVLVSVRQQFCVVDQYVQAS